MRSRCKVPLRMDATIWRCVYPSLLSFNDPSHLFPQHYSALSDDNKADVACSTAGMSSTVTVGRPIGTIQWTIISAPGAYHPPHADANGYHTVVQVIDGGAKVWAFARERRPVPTAAPRPGSGATLWQWAAFDGREVIIVALKDGDKA
jgi:hypothetical protein